MDIVKTLVVFVGKAAKLKTPTIKFVPLFRFFPTGVIRVKSDLIEAENADLRQCVIINTLF